MFEAVYKTGFSFCFIKNYVARLISALLKIKTTREDQWFILDLLLESPDIFLKQYMSALVMTAESNPEKWERTLEFIYASPNARTKRKLESILSSSIVNSGLKRRIWMPWVNFCQTRVCANIMKILLMMQLMK